MKLQVVELGGSRVLIVGVDDEVYAVSNKCSHLGLPIVGESAIVYAHSSMACVVQALSHGVDIAQTGRQSVMPDSVTMSLLGVQQALQLQSQAPQHPHTVAVRPAT